MQSGQQFQFERAVNWVLAEELAGYRFVKGTVVQITEPAEIQSLKEAMSAHHPPAREHMAKALALFADRENPNYAKVVQEGVSAVEAQLKELTGKWKVSEAVGDLSKLDRHHPQLLEAFKKLYGWASDDGSGIRHASKGDPPPSHAVAKFALVTCSAFVNYLEELRATQ